MLLRFILMPGFLKTLRDFPVTSEKVIILLCALTLSTQNSMAVKTRSLSQPTLCKHSSDPNYGCLTLIIETLKEDLKELRGE